MNSYVNRVRSLLLILLLVIVAGCASSPATAQPTTAVASNPPSAVPVLATTAPPAPPTPTPAPPTATPEPLPPTPEPPTPTPEVITGRLALVRGSLTERPFAVMLDNHPKAYPQSGMDNAVIVFEALAEFGITRYMAIFAPGISPELATIGPVRSARPYYVEWAKAFSSVYTHAGGSPEGLLLAETSIEIINNDALKGVSSRYFWRSKERAAPHNLFTSSANIAAFAASRNVETPDLSEIGFLFKPEASADQRPASQNLRYFFIYRESYVGWSYDPATNDYLYFRAGRPHVDATTGEQLRFKNLVLMEVPESPIPGDPKGRIEQQVIGEGKARIFRDGTMVEATWRKGAGFAQLRFYAADGSEILMNPGAVWIAAIPSMDNLTVEGGV
ncbi:DUF3048 domain-containing protein [Candidatus Oscillochloris fontis]|uniref:DUF3048 domain-containing protein n=1 Tax=Candidatus Oscillochloris fontis TaxID=2496868 RepID=UPI00101BB032|nr:DUF3048 domain-containing protein [Candidatus Oscillochloris fontis]